MNDDDRDAILTRRQRLVTLALAGLTTACDGPSEPPPQPCLTPVAREEPADPPFEVEPEGDPQPCLSVAIPDEETAPEDE